MRPFTPASTESCRAPTPTRGQGITFRSLPGRKQSHQFWGGSAYCLLWINVIDRDLLYNVPKNPARFDQTSVRRRRVMLGDAHLVFGHRHHLREHHGPFLNSRIVTRGALIRFAPLYFNPNKERGAMVVLAVL